jgi:uncharacterized membrane protein
VTAGRPTSFTRSVDVKRPAEEVFAFLANLLNDPTWRREWVDARSVTQGQQAVGSRTVLVGKALGRRMDIEYEVIELVPNRTIAWRSRSGPLPLTFSRSVEPIEAGTRITFVYELEGGRLVRLFRPLLARVGRRALEGDLPALTTLLES